MRTTAATLLALALAWPAGLAAEPPAAPPAEPADKKEEQPAARPAETSEVAPLQAREVIERLKTMRAQLLLEQEYNRLLEARLQRQELEQKIAATRGSKPEVASKAAPTSRLPPPPPRLESSGEQLIVKAVTVAPFKEAIVSYKGRVYTVRPGDQLGGIQIRDINENGVVTSGTGSGKAAVMLGQ